MVQQCVVVKEMFVYTASGEAIPVFRLGTVVGLLNCLHVRGLEMGLFSVLHIDVEMK